MVKFFTNNKEVDDYIDEFVSQQPYIPARIYVVMRCSYTEQDLYNETYTVELLHYYDDEYVWDNDWYEGEKYIEIHRLLTDDDILLVFGGY